MVEVILILAHYTTHRDIVLSSGRAQCNLAAIYIIFRVWFQRARGFTRKVSIPSRGHLPTNRTCLPCCSPHYSGPWPDTRLTPIWT